MATRSTARLDRELGELASRQYGVIARGQLLALGFGAGAIRGRIRSGRLTPVHAGVYLVGHVARARLATEMAAVLACGRGAVVSHRSAAVLWGLVAGTAGAVPVDVTVRYGWAPNRHGIRVHRRDAVERGDLRPMDGLTVTSPARTLFDLASLVNLAELEAAAAEGERRHGVRSAALADQLERNRGRPGAAGLRSLVERAERPALSRSKAERRLIALLRAHRVPSPEANQRLAGFQVDLLWRSARVVVEFDGFAFHADRGAFERDRQRDAELQAQGYRVIRVTWRQLTDHPTAVVSRIRRTLAIAAREVDRAPIRDTIHR
jgi:very-short-patch-repair endonuclease